MVLNILEISKPLKLNFIALFRETVLEFYKDSIKTTTNPKNQNITTKSESEFNDSIKGSTRRTTIKESMVPVSYKKKL